MMIMQVQLAMLIHNYTFHAVDDEITFKQGTTLLLDQNGIRMKIMRRQT